MLYEPQPAYRARLLLSIVVVTVIAICDFFGFGFSLDKTNLGFSLDESNISVLKEKIPSEMGVAPLHNPFDP